VDFIQTQAIYDIELAKTFMQKTAHLNTPILIGIVPFKSLGMMNFMIKFVPGISVPNEVQERLRQARKNGGKEAFLQENITIFSELIKEIKKTTKAAGIHLMAIGFESIVPEIIGSIS
jgi:methylenetetrahydrofolate reductase (NADPH)